MLIKKMLVPVLGKWWLPVARGGPDGMTSILTGEFQFPQLRKYHQQHIEQYPALVLQQKAHSLQV